VTRRLVAVATALTAVAIGSACASIRKEALRAAEEGIDPQPLVETLSRHHTAITRTKRIFEVELLQGGRRFRGEGALQYRSDPLRLRVDVFGPRSTPVVHVTLVDDRLTVVLPEEDEVVAGRLGDERFARLTGERALASREVLGALLGAYDVSALAATAHRVSAAADGDERTLYVSVDGETHAFTLGMPDDRLVEYRVARGDRPVYRVRFDEYAPVGDRRSPRRVVVRDFVGERTLVVNVTREHEDVPEGFVAREGG